MKPTIWVAKPGQGAIRVYDSQKASYLAEGYEVVPDPNTPEVVADRKEQDDLARRNVIKLMTSSGSVAYASPRQVAGLLAAGCVLASSGAAPAAAKPAAEVEAAKPAAEVEAAEPQAEVKAAEPKVEVEVTETKKAETKKSRKKEVRNEGFLFDRQQRSGEDLEERGDH